VADQHTMAVLQTLVETNVTLERLLARMDAKLDQV
jgi:hypothetical protein